MDWSAFNSTFFYLDVLFLVKYPLLLLPKLLLLLIHNLKDIGRQFFSNLLSSPFQIKTITPRRMDKLSSTLYNPSLITSTKSLPITLKKVW